MKTILLISFILFVQISNAQEALKYRATNVLFSINDKPLSKPYPIDCLIIMDSSTDMIYIFGEDETETFNILSIGKEFIENGESYQPIICVDQNGSKCSVFFKFGKPDQRSVSIYFVYETVSSIYWAYPTK